MMMDGPAARLDGLTDKAVRNGFIRKVYGILMTQLLVTTVCGGLVMKYCQQWLQTNPSLVMGMQFASIAVTIGVMCIFCCKPQLMRQSPINYIILAVFTLAESVMIGFICIQYTQESVLIVTGITTFVVFGLTLFACQTTSDFTGCGPYLMCGILVLMGMSFMFWIASMLGLGGSPAFQTMRMVYAGFGAMLFSFYIVYDTQLIVGGKHHKHQFSVDDYAMAAINLYLDIINLFLFLLQLFGDRR